MITESLPDQIVPFVRQYEFTRKDLIGKGGFGKVFKMVHPLDNVLYAVKRIALTRQNWQNALAEIRLLARVEHPHIVRYYHSWVDSITPSQREDSDDEEEEDDDVMVECGKRFFFCIQMEFCPMNLGDFLRCQSKVLPLVHVESLFQQVVDGLFYLHQHQIIHRDLKPENILLKQIDPYHVKISDFGLATWMDSNQSILRRTLYAGTFLYSPPEQYEKGLVSYSTDIFSAGIILYEMTCYFRTEMERISTLRELRHQRRIPLSHPFSCLLLSMTSPRMEERPSTYDLHKFFCDPVATFCRDLVWEIILHVFTLFDENKKKTQIIK